MLKFLKGNQISTLVLVCFASLSYGQDFFKEIPYGNHKVNFYTEILTDSSRYWNKKDKIFRDVQIQLWFPVNGRNGKIIYSDYFYFLGKSNNYKSITNPKARGERMHYFPARHFKSDSLQLIELSNISMRASRSNSLPKKIKKLIVFFSGASGVPLNNTPLFELFATHGYTVLNFPSQSSNSEVSYRDNIEGGIKEQYLDAKFLLSFLRSSLSETQEIHLIGVSSGSIAAYNLLENNDLKVASYVSLDGSVSYEIMKPFISNYKIPLLNVRTLLAFRDAEGLNEEFLSNPSEESFKILKYDNLRHADFSAGPLLYRYVDNFYGPAKKDFILSYESLIIEVLKFISEK
ncbi:hypothetical protein [Psychroserpens algicola]|uniref:Alpha/beta hydrolase n=1 Tax=Psychroserpens algicola TaxID=1719034 RepID=A0ABT0H7H4_9FLAO|nr:hypothetical protein [Psychroserpens algicola]MCK8479797.1 hypothetical protein [Psychroserpens algicola]